MTNDKITAKMTFSEVLEKYPDVIGIFLERGMHCIGCPASGFETIEQGAIIHGIDVKELINELNKKVSKNYKASKIYKNKVKGKDAKNKSKSINAKKMVK